MAPLIRSFVLGRHAAAPQPRPASNGDADEASSMPMKAADLKPGTRVVIFGLQGAAEHNGKVGTLLQQRDTASGPRWGVRLESGGQPLALRAVNLAKAEF
eukprot:5852537-Prymnesium_polylepis.1